MRKPKPVIMPAIRCRRRLSRNRLMRNNKIRRIPQERQLRKPQTPKERQWPSQWALPLLRRSSIAIGLC